MMPTPRMIPLGRLVATAAVAACLDRNPDVQGLIYGWLTQHRTGTCPHLDMEDRNANKAAMHYGSRILTSWPTGLPAPEDKIWIITESDRSATTLLFPSDY